MACFTKNTAKLFADMREGAADRLQYFLMPQAGVLLRALADARGAGGWHLNPAQAAALQQELLPQVRSTSWSILRLARLMARLIVQQQVLVFIVAADASSYVAGATALGCSAVCASDLSGAPSAPAVQAHAAFLSATIAYWAASTPVDASAAAAASAASGDPAALIGKLQLVAPAGGGRPRLAPARLAAGDACGGAAGGGGGGSITVAHLFLPELARQHGGEIFVVWSTRRCFRFSKDGVAVPTWHSRVGSKAATPKGQHLALDNGFHSTTPRAGDAQSPFTNVLYHFVPQASRWTTAWSPGPPASPRCCAHPAAVFPAAAQPSVSRQPAGSCRSFAAWFWVAVWGHLQLHLSAA